MASVKTNKMAKLAAAETEGDTSIFLIEIIEQ